MAESSITQDLPPTNQDSPPVLIEPPTPAPPKKKRRWYWRLFRWTVRLTVLAALAIGGTVAILSFRPLTGAWLDDRLHRAGFDGTGMNFSFENAQLILGRGLLEIAQPTFSDPETKAPLLQFNQLEIKLSMWAYARLMMGRGNKNYIPRISAEGPVNFEVIETDDGFEPSAQLQRIEELFRTHNEGKSPSTTRTQPQQSQGGSTIGLGNINIARVNVDVKRFEKVQSANGEKDKEKEEKKKSEEKEKTEKEKRKEEETTPKTFLRLRETNLLLQFRGTTRPRSIICVGRVQGPNDQSDFNLRLAPNPDREEMKIDLTLQPFDTRRHMMASVVRPLSLGLTNLSAMVRKQGTSENPVYNCTVNVTNPRITLIDFGQDDAEQQFNDASIYSELSYSKSDKLLKLAVNPFTSTEGTIKGKGQITLAEPYPYDAQFEQFRISGPGVELIERQLTSEKVLIAEPGQKGQIGTAVFDGTVHGKLSDGQPEDFSLNYQVSGLNFKTDKLPEPVSVLSLKGTMNGKEIAFNEGRVVFQDIPIDFAGKFSGKLNEGKISKGEVRLKTAGQVDGLSNLLAETSNSKTGPHISFRGDIKGEGLIRLDKPELGKWSEMIEKTDFEGSLQFNQAEVRHSNYKEPIRRLSGSMSVKGNEATFKGITGVVEDREFALEGRMTGKEDFWVKPVLDAKVRTSLELGEIEHYKEWFRPLDQAAAERDPSAFHLPDMRGAATVEANLRGPLGEWRAWSYEATLDLKNFALPLEETSHGELAGTVTFPALKVNLNPRELTIAEADGKWESIPLKAGGSINPNEGKFVMSLEGDSGQIKKLLVKPLRKFELAGPASATGQVLLTRLDRAQHPATTFNDLYPEPAPVDPKKSKPAPPKKTPAPKDTKPNDDTTPKQWKLEVSADADLKGLDFAQENMPDKLWGATGKIHITPDKLWSTEPVSMRIGNHAKENLIMVEVQFDKNDAGIPAIVNGKITGGYVDLDDWIRSWRPSPQRPESVDLWPDPEKSKVRVRIVVETDSMKYRGMEGKKLSGQLNFEKWMGHKSILSWQDARAEYKNGWAIVNGSLRHDGEIDKHAYEIQALDLEVADVMRSFFKVEKEGGFASGKISGHLNLEKADDDAPLNGYGSCVIHDSRFISNAIFGNLGKVLALEEIFSDISFNKIEGQFDVVNDAIVVRGDNEIVFENPSLVHPLSLRLKGQIGPQKKLDLDVALQFYSRASKIPVVGKVWDIVNSLTGRLLRYRIAGTLDSPRTDVLPRPIGNK